MWNLMLKLIIYNYYILIIVNYLTHYTFLKFIFV